MSDENWPANTPRDEMLARVVTRGTRIRAVRGAMNALVVLSVVGMSAFGVSAAVNSLSDGDSTEVDTIAAPPEPPEIGTGQIDGGTEPDTGVGTGDDPGAGSTPSTSGSGTTGVPTTTTITGGAGATGGGSSGPGGQSPSTTGTTGRPTSTTRPTTTTRPATTTTRPATTTTTTTVPTPTTAAAPLVGNVRMKDSVGAPMAMNICEDDANAVLSVEIRNAETATLSWNRAGETRSEPLTAGAAEWSAPIREIDTQNDDVPVVVTIEATGPGGTTRTSTTITVGDCSPLSSAPSVPGT